MDNSVASLSNINQKIDLILSASETAADLPITLQEIKEAKQQLDAARISAAGGQVEIEKLATKAGNTVERIRIEAEHAEQISSRIEDSYRAVTSQGLAHAFHLKERALRTSIYVWVAFLLISLCAMAVVGYFRFPEIQRALVGEPRWGVVVVELMLAALSLGAPTWFAIISTKQIGQRFRLAEDYGYKAAISAAYEGYRSEAARYGEDFQIRLFGSALDRLDEQPLRFVDHDTGGSPAHELFNSLAKVIDAKAAKDFLEKLPALLERWKSLATKTEKSKSEDGE